MRIGLAVLAVLFSACGGASRADVEREARRYVEREYGGARAASCVEGDRDREWDCAVPTPQGSIEVTVRVSKDGSGFLVTDE